MSVTQRLTADDYFARDFPPRSQLIDGEVVVDQPAFRHQRIAFFLTYRIAEWVEAGEGRGEAGFASDWVHGDHDVFVPDAWWTSEARRPPRDARKAYHFPDLAVEVRSPTTWRYDRGHKRDVYERGGALELWLVDTEADRIIVERRSTPGAAGFDVHLELAAGDVLGTPLCPGLSIDVRELFDR